MPEYLPYVNGYGGVPKLFAAIKSASVPPKFTSDFMTTALGLKSSSYRAMIPLLKKLGFIDQANVPTQAYKDFRDDSLSGSVMAAKLQEAYRSLYVANEYAHKLEKKELQAKLKTVTGAGDDDPYLPLVAATFSELVKLATWNGHKPTVKKDEPAAPNPVTTPVPVVPITPHVVTSSVPHGGYEPIAAKGRGIGTNLGLSYTINLNLPATTEVEVFNAIFKSLRDNLLR